MSRAPIAVSDCRAHSRMLGLSAQVSQSLRRGEYRREHQGESGPEHSVERSRLVALAGGTTRTAKLNGSKILRKTPDGIKETRIPLKKILQAKAPDVPLQADDILFVPGSAAKAAAYRGTESVLQAATALSIVAFRP